MSLKHLFSSRQAGHTSQRLKRSVHALMGIDADGNRLSPPMDDPAMLSLAQGNGIRRPHPSVLSAGVKGLADHHYSLDHYLFFDPHIEFAVEASRFFQKSGIPESHASNITIGPGTAPLFSAFLYVFGNQGDVFLTQDTFYHATTYWTETTQTVLQNVPTKQENGYKLLEEDLENWIAKNAGTKAKGLILYNPTQIGEVYSKEELEGIARVLDRHDMVALMDSTFSGTEFDQSQTPALAAIPEISSRVVTVMSASKTFGLANIRMGWACGDAAAIEKIDEYIKKTHVAVPHLAQTMTLAALQAPKEYLAENASELTKRCSMMNDLISETNEKASAALGLSETVEFIKVLNIPKAAHSMLVNLDALAGLKRADGQTIKDSVDLTTHFLNHNVVLAPGYSFGFDDCTFKISFGDVESRLGYPATKEAELSEIFRAAAELKGIDIPDQKSGIFAEEVFAPGRAKIAEAFRERILPAIVDLVQFNRRHFPHTVPAALMNNQPETNALSLNHA